MILQGKKVAIFVDQLYQEMEVWYPYYRLVEAGAVVDLVAAEAGKSYPSKLGYPCVSHKSYDQVSAADYDGVVAPGGFAPDFIRRHPKANQFISDMDGQGKLVAAICHGLWCCCSANVLRGKHCTSFFAIKDDVVNAGGIWEDSEVVVDGNLVSARKPDDLPAFMRAAMHVLTRRSNA
ncbi:type 1 glutamine amidotransferase domain-containing protein [uncultured Desulfobulbus sp.]|uniref:type 1 glutamine amidotransferase domain-containing protein n=1 Tax=uncultured Desulfobulbus sp. TaxID=239745 RepID=UPI0029C64391|nr:type 1 glutamine amidotransferase domain-containing protein [uncultured Desulfobulbus sp.]